MTIDEKKQRVARAIAASIAYDAENSTSVGDEINRLVFGGFVGVTTWTEEQLDTWLNSHDSLGQPYEEDDT